MRTDLRSILVSVTEACHVGCRHCGFIGSTRDREAGAGLLANWVAQACEYGIPLVIFTGGEPFERFEVLERLVATCRAAGTPAASFTSSYWATDPKTTVAYLERLDGLDISIRAPISTISVAFPTRTSTTSSTRRTCSAYRT